MKVMDIMLRKQQILTLKTLSISECQCPLNDYGTSKTAKITLMPHWALNIVTRLSNAQ